VGSFNEKKNLLQICKQFFFFQEALHFQKIIVLYYNKQIVVRVIARMPPPLTWYISQIIVDVFSPIVSTCVFNQSKGHWLLRFFKFNHFHLFEIDKKNLEF